MSPQPDVPALLTAFGLHRVEDVRATDSELDRTWLVRTAEGGVVLKLSPPGSDAPRMQSGLLDRVAAADPRLPVPRVLRTPDGAALVSSPAGTAWLSTLLPGDALDTTVPTAALVGEIAALQARLLTALAGTDPRTAGVPRVHEWDIDAVVAHEHLIDRHLGPALAPTAHAVVAAYREDVGPRRPSLPRQVLHADLNLSNVLVTSGHVTGIIDFGDAVHAPRVHDVALTACYLAIALGDLDDPVVLRYRERAAALVRLTAQERALLPLLALARLVIALVLGREQARRAPARAAYALRYDAPAAALLAGVAERGLPARLPSAPVRPRATSAHARKKASL
ncbi:MAG TPA: phosphotransferase [Cellulomonas sp.]